MKSLVYMDLTIGADPELFFSKNGRIIGSERILQGGKLEKNPAYGLGPVEVVEDGVQAELHPRPFACRANFSDSLKLTFQCLDEALQKHPGVELDFRPVVRVTKAELNRLSEKSRVLGCQPSFNLYGLMPIDASGIVQTRVAGGHFHLGTNYIESPVKLNAGRGYTTPDQLVRLLDTIVGNIGVLLTKGDKAERVRREMYGRAGEYRLPVHGLEYRTLSNFWLRAYPVFSMITGLLHTTCGIAHTASPSVKSGYGWRADGAPNPTFASYTQRIAFDTQDRIFAAVPVPEIVQTIQDNDYAAASAVWKKVRPIYAELSVSRGPNAQTLDQFDYFVDKGLDHWFPPTTWNILRHWADKPDGHGTGWEAWCQRTVWPQFMSDVNWKNPFAPEGWQHPYVKTGVTVAVPQAAVI